MIVNLCMHRGDNVKSKRRVEIHIERREVSIFRSPGFVAAQPSATTRELAGGGPCLRPAACPTCGSGDLLLLAEAVTLAGMDVDRLQTGLEDGRFHLHCATSGEWWICRQSGGPNPGEAA